MIETMNETQNQERRMAKAYAILSREDKPEEIDENTFRILSQNGNWYYTIKKNGSGEFFVFCKGENYPQLFLVDKERRIKSRDVSTILATIKCSEKEERAVIPKGMNAIVSYIKTLFDREFKQRRAELEYTKKLTIAQRYVKRELDALYKKTDNEEIKHQIEILGEVFRRGDLSMIIHKKLNAIKKNKTTDEQLLKRLQRIYAEDNLSSLLDKKEEKISEVVRTRIICSEALL